MSTTPTPTASIDQVRTALENVRKKQLKLAAEHLALDSMLGINIMTIDNDDEIAKLFEQNEVKFQDRERSLTKLMNGLVDLTNSTSELFDIADKAK